MALPRTQVSKQIDVRAGGLFHTNFSALHRARCIGPTRPLSPTRLYTKSRLGGPEEATYQPLPDADEFPDAKALEQAVDDYFAKINPKPKPIQGTHTKAKMITKFAPS